METVNRSLVWIRDNPGVSVEAVLEMFENQPAVTRAFAAHCAKGLIFVDYQPQTSSLSRLVQNLQTDGVTARIIGM